MNVGDLELRLDPRAERPAFARPLADVECRSDVPLLPGALASGVLSPLAETRPARNSRTIYDGPGIVFDAAERIVASVAGETTFVAYGDRDAFEVTNRLVARRDGVEGDPRKSLARALGAPLAIYFAPRSVFIVHASAIAASDGAAIVLAGDSGLGKSTFAAEAARLPGVVRLGDDQFPVRLSFESVGLPHWPQLKLAARDQYPEGAPRETPIRALVELALVDAGREPRLELLPPARCAAVWIGSTVAARLFDSERLQLHFEGASAAANRLPGYRLEVPRGLDRLPRSVELLLQNV